MEKVKKTTRKKATAGAEAIKTAFINDYLTEGRRPASVFKFCLDHSIKEEEFYAHFGSFESLEREVWKGFIEETIKLLSNDASYAGFSARERVLSFYYTLLEVLKRNRSFVLVQLGERRRPELTPAFLTDFRKSFETFFGQLMAQAQAGGEVASRPYLDKVYLPAFWLHFEFVLHFWKNDNSAGFEQTDAAVEKSVNLAFDLISKGAFDRAIDFAKFLYQNRN
jgi:AcrR family transcriptional regulator